MLVRMMWHIGQCVLSSLLRSWIRRNRRMLILINVLIWDCDQNHHQHQYPKKWYLHLKDHQSVLYQLDYELDD